MLFEANLENVEKIMALVAAEREKALSEREWKHRLVGYGYSIKDTSEGKVVTTWPMGAEIGLLPSVNAEDAD